MGVILIPSFPYWPHLIAHTVLLMSLQKPLFSIMDLISSFGLLEPGSIPHVELPVIFPKKRLSKSFEKKNGVSSLDSQMISKMIITSSILSYDSILESSSSN